MFNKNIAIEGKQAYYISELMEHNFFPRIIDFSTYYAPKMIYHHMLLVPCFNTPSIY